MECRLILNAKGFEKHHQLGSITIYSSGCLPTSLNSFIDAKCKATWQNHYQPFAAVIHDVQNNAILLVRDHLGIEPLYYHYIEGFLIVGQSIHDILAYLNKPPSHNQDYLNKLFTDCSMPYTNDTHFQEIYRLEPGHMLLIDSTGIGIPKAFWQLEKEAATLFYADDRDYLAHFTYLMQESLLNAIGPNANHCALEFSAGLDSSSLYCTAKELNISPTLFMHQAPMDTSFSEKYNDAFEKAFLNHYQNAKLERICAKSFDAISIFKQYANWFAGPAPYLFFMFSNPLHHAVVNGQYPILLSGFGGDQCVSGIVPMNFYMPQLIQNHQYQQAWKEIKDRSLLRKSLIFSQFCHPSIYRMAILRKKIYRQLKLTSKLVHPYLRKSYHTLRAAELSLLQGPDSFEVRMRIEYSSIVAKQMGFSYRYPLLYPKLLEFMCALPLSQKRGDGSGRYMIRRYLEQYLGKQIVSLYNKKGGLDIFPSTYHLFQQTYDNGGYDSDFQNLSNKHIKSTGTVIEMHNKIQAFMLQSFSPLD